MKKYILKIKRLIYFLRNFGFKYTFYKVLSIVSGNSFFSEKMNSFDKETFVSFKQLPLPISKDPLVSVLVALYKPNKHKISILAESFYEIKKNSRCEFLILVNQGSEKDVEKLKKDFPETNFFFEKENIGFSKAIDRLCYESSGEILLIHNDDAKIDSGLNYLIQTLHDPSVAAAVPKINFYQDFYKISFLSKNNCRINISASSNNDLPVKILPEMRSYELKLENNEVKEIYVSDNVKDFLITNSSNENKVQIFIENDSLAIKNVNKFNILNTFRNLKEGEKYSIINNAGSHEDSNGNFSDIGIYEPDIGQYDKAKEINAVCGCMLLLKKNVLFNQGPFIENFFAYFEDSYLSRRLRALDVKMIYEPKCKALHLHKLSSSNDSLEFEKKLALNKMLLEMKPKLDIFCTTNFLLELQHNYKYQNKFDLATRTYYERIVRECYIDLYAKKHGLVFCIFNEWWDSAGGGEKHALAFVEVLQKYGKVDIASYEDFDIKNLEDKFSLDLSKCRKKLISPHSINTMGYEIFINASYRNNLSSLAYKSYYILSFALQDFNSDLSEYKFLANSEYTLRWSQKIMPYNRDQYFILHPSIENRPQPNLEKEREKNIVTIGRIHKPGNQHNKNFEFMIKAFEKANLEGYRLKIVGSCNSNLREDANYLDFLKSRVKNKNIDINENISREELNSILNTSSIYWHATGLGADKENEPHKFEHFGIAPIEAISAGLIPLVFNVGGPHENLKNFDSWDASFENENDLINKTHQISKFGKNKINIIRKNLISYSKNFSKEKFNRNVEKIFEIN